jgi:hypothetical protein
LSTPLDILARQKGIGPNQISGSGVKTRQEIIDNQADLARQQAQANAKKAALDKQLALQKKRSSRHGHTPSWFIESQKKDQEEKQKQQQQQKKAQSDAEFDTIFSTFKETKKKAAEQGVDISSATIKITHDKKTVGELKQSGVEVPKGALSDDQIVAVNSVKVSNVKGLQSKQAKDLQDKRFTDKLIDNTIHDLKNKGYDVNQATIKVHKDQSNNFKVNVSGFKIPKQEAITPGPTTTSELVNQFTPKEAQLKRREQIHDTLRDIEPGHQAEAAKILYKESVGQKGTSNIFIEKDLKQFVKDFNANLKAPTIEESPNIYFNPDPTNPFNVQSLPKEGGSKVISLPGGFVKQFSFEKGKDQIDVIDLTDYGGSPNVKVGPAPTGDIAKDFVSGAVENLKGLYTDIGSPFALSVNNKGPGKVSIDTYEFDVAAQPERDVTNLAIRSYGQVALSNGFVKAGKTDVTQADFEQVGKNIVANPAFSAGSLTASAITFIPDKAVEGVKVLTGLAKVAKVGTGVRFTEGATKAIDVLKIGKAEDITYQAVKINKANGIAEPVKAGLNIEKSKSVFFIGTKPIVIPKFKPSYIKPDYFEALGKDGELLGTVSAKTGRIELASEPLTNFEGFKLVGQGKSLAKDSFESKRLLKQGLTKKEQLDLKASDVTQVFESYGTGKQAPKLLSDKELDAAEKLIAKPGLENVSGAKNIVQPKALPKASEQSGSIIGINQSEISKYLKGVKLEADLGKANKSILGDLTKLGKKPKAKSKFKVSNPLTASSATPYKGLLSQSFDQGLQAAGEKLRKSLEASAKQTGSKAEKSSLNGLSSGPKIATGLGLGGGVWPSKKALDSEIEVIAFPKNKQGPTIKIGTTVNELIKSTTRSGQGNKSNQTIKLENIVRDLQRGDQTLKLKDLLNVKGLEILKTKNNIKDNQRINIRTDQGQRSFRIQDFAFDVKFDQATKLDFVQRRRQRTRLDIPKVELPRLNLPKFAGHYQRSRGSKRKTKVKIIDREFEVKDLISASLGVDNPIAKNFRKQFGNAF